jgi:hypothetical protein
VWMWSGAANGTARNGLAVAGLGKRARNGLVVDISAASSSVLVQPVSRVVSSARFFYYF